MVYGHNIEPISLSLDSKELEDLLRSVSIENTIISLQIEGGPEQPISTLVREIQRHPFRDQIFHMDFMQISMQEEVDVEVPVALLGTPVGVRATGGILQHQMREILISCLPGDIPEKIEVDVSELAIGDSIHVRDLKVEGVEILSDLDGLVATVLPPTVIKEEVRPEEVEEEEMEPELVGREREEEEKPEDRKGEEAGSGKEE